jgi:hypothetical protein
MNENDVDRYFWRTGQRWSGDDRPVRAACKLKDLEVEQFGL